MNENTIDYVMRGVTGIYDYPWTNQEDKLHNFRLHTNNSFKNDNITLYLIYSQYICNKGVGSNIINNYHSTKNGCKCHQDFELKFRNDSYLTNKATNVTSNMNSAFDNGDHRNFIIETYYEIMLKTFIDLSAALSAHALKYTKKINSFEKGLNEPQAIHWCIILKERWEKLPPA